ncbi:MAG: radical SAM protein [Candidatus Woesearchaeota archaeon]
MQGYIKKIEELHTEILGNVLGIHFLGCNLNCPFCPKYEERVFDEIYLRDFSDIKRVISQTNNNKVLIYGGEPLLQADLILEIFRNYRMSREIWILTNLSKIENLKILLENDVKNFIISWWSSDNLLFNRLTNTRSFFSNEKIVLYDIFYSLHLLKKYNIIPYFKFTLLPGIFYTKDQIVNELEFISNFGFYPFVILTPFNPSISRGRYKLLNSLSSEYLSNLTENLSNLGYRAIVDPSLF